MFEDLRTKYASKVAKARKNSNPDFCLQRFLRSGKRACKERTVSGVNVCFQIKMEKSLLYGKKYN